MIEWQIGIDDGDGGVRYKTEFETSDVVAAIFSVGLAVLGVAGMFFISGVVSAMAGWVSIYTVIGSPILQLIGGMGIGLMGVAALVQLL